MKKISYLLILGLFAACSNEPKPIDYGNDNCNFCEMTIVSQVYSSQAVSDKGKQYKYDAIECMVKDQLQHNYDMAVHLVANYEEPGSMINVNKAGFVINDSIKSPMGGNLAAFKKESAIIKDAEEGTYSWNELMKHFKQQGSDTMSYE